LPFTADENLPLPTDPKEAWAEIHLKHNPIEMNNATPRQLLRVPGVGPKTVKKILGARRMRELRDLSQLKKLGIATKRAAPFILLGGKKVASQARLF